MLTGTTSSTCRVSIKITCRLYINDDRGTMNDEVKDTAFNSSFRLNPSSLLLVANAGWEYTAKADLNPLAGSTPAPFA